jgi:type IV secretion system protein VirB5
MFRKTALAMAFLASTELVLASGIPTIDVSGIAQMVVNNSARAKEFSESLAEAQKRLQQLKAAADHYKAMVEGHYSFEDILNSPTVNSDFALDNWKDIYSDTSEIEDLREEFNMYSDDPENQKKLDQALMNFKAQRGYYNGAVARNTRMQALLSDFASVTTPAQKSDIANAINFEQLQIQNDTQMMNTMNQLMEQQVTLEVDQSARDSMKKSWNTKATYIGND